MISRFIYRGLMLYSLILSPIQAFSQQRIVTAGSAITETVCALGACSTIVATDLTSLFPSEVQALPSIGYRSGISAEGIISQRPTLVIVEKDYVEDGVLAQVQSTGIELLVIERVYSLEGTRDMISEIATALSKREEGHSLVLQIERKIKEAAQLIGTSDFTPRVLCVYNRGAASVNAAGTNTFSGILPYVGAKTAIEGIDGYKAINAEALIAANPDYILFLQSGLEGIGGIEGALKIQGVAQTTAGLKRQIIALDAVKLTNFGPRFGDTVLELVYRLHPDLNK